MDMNTYQKEAVSFAVYTNPNYPLFAFVEETGEFFGKLAKQARGDAGYQDTEKLNSMIRKEMGDILWNIANICNDRGWQMGDIAAENIDKLVDRKARNTIRGDGDAR